jgi:hypothetical protein
VPERIADPISADEYERLELTAWHRPPNRDARPEDPIALRAFMGRCSGRHLSALTEGATRKSLDDRPLPPDRSGLGPETGSQLDGIETGLKSATVRRAA